MQFQRFTNPFLFSCHSNGKSQYISISVPVPVFFFRADILHISVITRIHRIVNPDACSTQMHVAASRSTQNALKRLVIMPGLQRYYRALFAHECQYSLLEYRLRFRTGIRYGIRFVVGVSPELQSVISYERCADRKCASLSSRVLAKSIFHLGNIL